MDIEMAYVDFGDPFWFMFSTRWEMGDVDKWGEMFMILGRGRRMTLKSSISQFGWDKWKWRQINQMICRTS